MITFTLVVLLVAIPLNILHSLLMHRIVLAILIITVFIHTQDFFYNEIVISATLQVNPLLNGMEILVIFLGGLILTLNISKMPSREFSLIILFSIIGSCIIISSTDILSLYLGIELQSFSLYILAALYYDQAKSVSAGLKYFLLGALASTIILLGIGMLYNSIGTTSLEDMTMLMSKKSNIFGINLILLGLLFKLSAAPFHSWAPYVYNNTPTLITTFLITVPKISYLITIAILTNIFMNDIMLKIITISAALSITVGSIIGISQIFIKRIMAYSTINHVGFILIIIINSTVESDISLIFYIIQYSVTNFATFLIILALNDNTLVSQLKGLAYKQPYLALTFTIILLSMAGVPPIMGFFAKYSVLYSLILTQNYLLSVLAVLASIVSAVYYLGLISTMYFTNTSENVTSPEEIPSLMSDLSNTISYMISVIFIFTITFWMYPNLILNCTELLALFFT